jgi:hypothetical protein
VNCSAATTEFKFGWLVEPLIEAMARSAMSTPLRRGQNTRCGDAARVVRVEMNWHSNLGLERLDEQLRCGRFAQSRHVLDRKHVRPHFSKFFASST